jgi:hypothetical protein
MAVELRLQLIGELAREFEFVRKHPHVDEKFRTFSPGRAKSVLGRMLLWDSLKQWKARCIERSPEERESEVEPDYDELYARDKASGRLDVLEGGRYEAEQRSGNNGQEPTLEEVPFPD